MILQDKREHEKQHAKNAVEEYVYHMREKLSGEYEKFISEQVRQAACLLPIERPRS